MLLLALMFWNPSFQSGSGKLIRIWTQIRVGNSGFHSGVTMDEYNRCYRYYAVWWIGICYLLVTCEMIVGGPRMALGTMLELGGAFS